MIKCPLLIHIISLNYVYSKTNVANTDELAKSLKILFQED